MSEVLPELEAPARGTRLWRWALWLVAGLLLLWVVAWLAVPPIVKSQTEQRLSTLLGREVRIGRIGFSPWSLTLTVESLSIAAAAGAGAGAEPQLSIQRVVANADLRSLLRLAPVLEALEIDVPRLRVARVADGRYDFDDIVERFAKTPAPPDTDAEPARFALYNLKLQGGSVEFDDRPMKRVHRLQDLQVALPFLSNLSDHDVTVDVLPRLAFNLNGAAFDSGAQSKPFAQDRASQIDLRITDLDLAPWLPYVPASLPLKPTRGKLVTQLQVQFAQAADGAPRVSLRGNASLADAAFAAAGAASAPAVAWRHLDVALSDVQPLARKIALGNVTLGGVTVDARRDAQGRINLLPATAAAPAAAVAASAPASAASAAVAPGTRAAWQVSVARFALNQARIDWHDASTQPAVALRAEPVDLQLGPVLWPFEAPVPLKLVGRIGAPGATDAAEFTVQGEASDRAAKATLDVQALDLRWFAPYVAQALVPLLDGRVALAATVDWAGGDQPRLALSQITASVKDLRLIEGVAAVRSTRPTPRKAATPAPAAVSVASLALGDSSVDLRGRRVVVGSFTVEQPALRLSRSREGQWNLLGWARPAPPAAASDSTPAAQPWQVQVGEAQVKGGEVHLRDEYPNDAALKLGEVVSLVADGINANVNGLTWPGAVLARTQLQLRLAAARSAGAQRPQAPAKAAANIGRIAWNGQLATAPLQARGTLRIERAPVHLFEPYFRRDLNLDLLRAEATWRGDVAVAQRSGGLEASARGDALLGDVRVNERLTPDAQVSATQGDELLSWQSFALRGLQFTLKPGAKPSLDIKEAALTDFYSRLVITEQGRFNLRDVAVAPATAASAPAPAAAPATPATAPVAAVPATAAASTPPRGALPIDISIGGTQLANGKVDFTDRFIRPNFSAALTALNGRLGPFNSASQDMATLDLRGIAAGTAQLEISGALNPTANPLALDIRAKATNLELAPLSPYAGRYAGYGIERGKLSMDLAYKIDPDGKLDAKNQVILNQLTFGEKVDSPDATKLPVLLAVALLKDRNGVIDINLPISGSINDPQFSIWGLVFRIIGNLLAKAVTAPFALLAGGGSDDLSYVAFEPGTANVTDGGRANIDKVAKALMDRPSLKMTVTGASDPVSEREASQKAALEARIRAEQRREALRAGAASDAPLPPLTPALRESLVRRVYGDTSLPNKPRNAIGLTKDIPAAEMEALLLNATQVTTDTARELALQRGLAVRDALIAKGLPSERLFLAAPKLRASGEEDAAWSPRVQLALSTT